MLERTPGWGSSDSLVERFGLFTIIVLGEVIVGVVDGIADAGRTTLAIVTGMVGLMIGFAYWWTYFDFVGGRRLRTRGPAQSRRGCLGHLPVTMSIAATGAAMVSLIEHASDDRAPKATAWLLSGSVAVGLLALIVIMSVLHDAARLPHVYRPVSIALVAAAAVALVVGWLRPTPWVLALLLVTALSAVWFFAIIR